jgi:hypothetical protein
MPVANGCITGTSVAALGPFFEVGEPVHGDNVDGWPLFDNRQTFAAIGGFWHSQLSLGGTNYARLSQYGWDTAISGIPHWSAIVLCLDNGKGLDTSNSTMDFMRGLTGELVLYVATHINCVVPYCVSNVGPQIVVRMKN